jgi:hypothetical protein
MRRLVPAAVLLSVLAAGCSLGGDGDHGSAVEEADLVFELGRPFVETDEPRGLAGATSEGEEETRVVISLDDPPEPKMTASIRTGDCLGSTGGSAIYPLNDVEDGKSETVVDVSLAELRDRGYIVWIGDFARDGPLCGDFFGAEEN